MQRKKLRSHDLALAIGESKLQFLVPLIRGHKTPASRHNKGGAVSDTALWVAKLARYTAASVRRTESVGSKRPAPIGRRSAVIKLA
jgi:hypothetical protein